MNRLKPFLFLIVPAICLLTVCFIYPWLPYFGETKFYLIWHKYFVANPVGYWSGFGGNFFQVPLLATWWFLIFQIFSGSVLAFHLLQIPFALGCIYFTIALVENVSTKKLTHVHKILLSLILLALPAFVTDTLFSGVNVIIAAFFLAIFYAIANKHWRHLYWLLPVFVLLHVRTWVCLPGIIVFAALQLQQPKKVLQYVWPGLAVFGGLLVAGLAMGLEFTFSVLSQTGKPFPVTGYLTKSSYWLAELLITGRVAIFIALLLSATIILLSKKTFSKVTLQWLIASGTVLLTWLLIHLFNRPINSAVVFLPVILLLMASLFQFLGQLPRAVTIGFTILVTGTLISGNFWRLPRQYPQTIDSSFRALGMVKMENAMYNKFMPVVRINRYATYAPAYFSTDPFFWGDAKKPYFNEAMEYQCILVTDLTNTKHNKMWTKAFSKGDLVYKRRTIMGNYIALYQLQQTNDDE